jgi:hypothetical protein
MKGSAVLQVWRDSRGRLSFRVSSGHGWGYYRYSPRTFTLTEFPQPGGSLPVAVTYESARAAWAQIHSLYGVDEADVTKALASGEPSREPPSNASPGTIIHTTRYGTDFGRMAAATGLVLPRLRKLDGLSLRNLSNLLPQDLSHMYYGLPSHEIELVILKDDHGQPDSTVPVKAKSYGRVAGTRYAIQSWRVIFPYRGEWIEVRPFGVGISKRLDSIVRAIVTAPTVD